MSSPVIPDKLFFKIGEVAKITGVKPYILRYWESEFPHLRPTKGRSQHRLYRRKDVEDILKIKSLLYEQKFTIAGAKSVLKGNTPDPSDMPVAQKAATLPKGPTITADRREKLRGELGAIRELVERL